MKSITLATFLSLLGFVAAQSSTSASESLPPSPTESVGCEPHGDHWHCEAAATATGTASVDDDAASAGSSPTESIGCEPHGDHWHCEGPAVTGAANATATDDHQDHDDHTDAEGTGSLPPSPTASVGCEPHGDHWHCYGPASTTVADNAAQTSSSSSADVTPAANTGAAEKLFVGAGALVVAAVAAL